MGALNGSHGRGFAPGDLATVRARTVAERDAAISTSEAARATSEAARERADQLDKLLAVDRRLDDDARPTLVRRQEIAARPAARTRRPPRPTPKRRPRPPGSDALGRVHPRPVRGWVTGG